MRAVAASGKGSRNLEANFQGVVRDGIANREFRPDADPRLATLAILGMANWVSQWYGRKKSRWSGSAMNL